MAWSTIRQGQRRKFIANFAIVKGPGKYDLERGIMDGKVLRFTVHKRSLSIMVSDQEFMVYLENLGPLDRSKDSWEMSGMVVAIDREEKFGQVFEGNYCVSKHEGVIRIFCSEPSKPLKSKNKL
ncbi:MAG: hypothetical protein WCW02_00230 [Candidatus Buchananbacteria bacterium]